jgi:hypothetical protein
MPDMCTKTDQRRGGTPSRHRRSVVPHHCPCSHLHLQAYRLWCSAFTTLIVQSVPPGQGVCTRCHHVANTSVSPSHIWTKLGCSFERGGCVAALHPLAGACGAHTESRESKSHELYTKGDPFTNMFRLTPSMANHKYHVQVVMQGCKQRRDFHTNGRSACVTVQAVASRRNASAP